MHDLSPLLTTENFLIISVSLVVGALSQLCIRLLQICIRLLTRTSKDTNVVNLPLSDIANLCLNILEVELWGCNFSVINSPWLYPTTQNAPFAILLKRCHKRDKDWVGGWIYYDSIHNINACLEPHERDVIDKKIVSLVSKLRQRYEANEKKVAKEFKEKQLSAMQKFACVLPEALPVEQ